MTRNEVSLLLLLIALVAIALFATAGYELHHLLSHLDFSQGGAQ